MFDEQGMPPTRLTKWDVLALLADTSSAIFLNIANGLDILSRMLEHQASFVDEQESFHEYVARTIETLQEGE
jgi:hypothetical protein